MGELMTVKRKGKLGFVLLEVLVAIVVLGVAMVALMKGFILSLDTLGKVKMNEQAILLAQTLMDDLILEPPAEGDYEGEFSEDNRFGEDFEGWKWELEVWTEEPDYEERPRGNMSQDLEQLYFVKASIIYSNQWGKKRKQRDTRKYLEFHTILMEPDIFSISAIEENQLF
jgi:prepilin-type N-terminal cleavage/methylation domain-containing protein